MRIQNQIKTNGYISAGFIRHYQKLVTEKMIPYQYHVLKDEVPGVEKSHALQNFINAGSLKRSGDPGDGFYGWVFQDSDVAKWLEAAAYSLINTPDPELEQKIDEVIRIIGDAQADDGYLNTYFTLERPGKRMTNLAEAHELYSAGHMTEAAVAYYEATGKDSLLKIMQRVMAFFYRYFITEGHDGYPGHPEIELALVRLYEATGDERALTLARHFVDVRGEDPEFFMKEHRARGWSCWNDHGNMIPTYFQAHAPIRAQKAAIGHAVRAVYLYTGAAGTAMLTEDAGLLEALDGLWDNITKKQMYVTGAIGSSPIGEDFTVDYDLPNDSVYGETCASIGLMFFAAAMLEQKIDSKYADVMERAFYNTVIAGLSLDGTQYFYVNPLEAVPGISAVANTKSHVLISRPGWYNCACCPPNAARLIESFGRYAYGENETMAFCHLYAAGTVRLENGMVFTCETGFPYDFTVRYRLETAGRLAIRIPDWSKKYELHLNGKPVGSAPDHGYVYLDVQAGDDVTLVLDDSVRVIRGNNRVPSLSGRSCLQRGPLVYCFEGQDNGGRVLDLYLKKNGRIETGAYDPDTLSGIVPLTAEGYRESGMEALYTDAEPEYRPVQLKAIPYYAWANRGENEMRVWLPVMQ